MIFANGGNDRSIHDGSLQTPFTGLPGHEFLGTIFKADVISVDVSLFEIFLSVRPIFLSVIFYLASQTSLPKPLHS